MSSEVAALREVMEELVAVERQKSRRLAVGVVVALVLILAFGATFVGIAIANRMTVEHLDGKFDGLACYASELADEPPPQGIPCPTA